MKTPKCPLCGKIFKLSTIENKGQLHFFACYKCNYQLRMSPRKDFALEYANDFISKFPPIMRLKPGDLIKIRKLPDNFFVIKTDVEKGVIRAGSTYGYSMSYGAEDIEQWPWEIMQKKGGQQ